MSDQLSVNDQILIYKRQYNSDMNKVSNYFRLSPDDRETAKLYALWRFVKTYDPTKSAQRTHIINCMRYECYKMLDENAKFKSNNILSDYEQDQSSVILDVLNKEEEELINLYCISKMTLKELAAKYNVSYETIRNRLKRIKQLIAEDFGVLSCR